MITGKLGIYRGLGPHRAFSCVSPRQPTSAYVSPLQLGAAGVVFLHGEKPPNGRFRAVTPPHATLPSVPACGAARGRTGSTARSDTCAPASAGGPRTAQGAAGTGLVRRCLRRAFRPLTSDPELFVQAVPLAVVPARNRGNGSSFRKCCFRTQGSGKTGGVLWLMSPWALK